MKVSVVTAPGETQVVDAPKPHGRARGRARQDPGMRNLRHRHAFHLDGRLAVAAVHKQRVPVDLFNLMGNEITIVGSMGYPDEIFEVTKELIANWEEYAVIVSHTIPFDDVVQALKAASTPGAADKVVGTFN